MTRPTDEQLDDLARLEAGATPGEWFWIFDEAYEAGGVEGADITVEDGRIAYRLAKATTYLTKLAPGAYHRPTARGRS